jgi:hypothetical protein
LHRGWQELTGDRELTSGVTTGCGSAAVARQSHQRRLSGGGETTGRDQRRWAGLVACASRRVYNRQPSKSSYPR